MRRKFKVILPGPEVVKIKLGFYCYSDNKTLIIEADSIYEAYGKYPNAISIKELKEFDCLKNSILFFNKKNI